MSKAVLAGAAVVSALAASTGAVMQNQNAIKGRRMQRDAQQKAEANAMKQNQIAEQNIAAAKDKKPDLAALLQSLSGSGGGITPPSTLLTGQPSTKLGQ